MGRIPRNLVNQSPEPSSGAEKADPDKASVPVLRDRELVNRCLAADAEAWDTLYAQYHNGLLFSIRLMLGPGEWDANVVDEIAARVWYVLVENNGRVLGLFDVKRGCRLSTFLARVARSEASVFFRGERRRRRREKVASKPEVEVNAFTPVQLAARIREFGQVLTPREYEFVSSFLLEPAGEADVGDFSPANRWQLSRRVREKLYQFMD